MMQVPPADLADRLTILLLKVAHGLDMCAELDAYRHEFRAYWAIPGVDDVVMDLFLANAAIWQLEWQVRQGREGELGLEEVGRRALAIRDHNAERIRLKNRIADLTGSPFREWKTAHASEDIRG
jgi:hypothetical protein